MALSTPKWTLLQVNGSERPIYGDKKAGTATIKPGMICALAANDVINPVSAADVVLSGIVAVEAGWENTNLSLSVQDQPYALGDTVNYVYTQPGDLVYLWLSASQTAVVGSLLAASGTAGEVSVEATNKDQSVSFIAEEAVTTTGSAARIRARRI